MTELDEILKDLKQCLNTKEDDINSMPKASAYVVSALQNKKLEVALFEKGIREVTTDPTQKTNIINNFTKAATELKNAINDID